MVEAIGYLTLIAAGIFIGFSLISSKEDFEVKKEKFIENSTDMAYFNRSYVKSLREDKPIMTKSSYKRAIRNMMNDPKIITEVNRRILEKKVRDNEYKDLRRKQRKIGYKYEDSIFEIFGENRELPKEYIIIRIKELFRYEGLEEMVYEKKANEMFHLWLENELIENCCWNKENYEIGIILRQNIYSLDNEDITWDKWLELKGLKLKPTSKEYDNYMDDLPF